MRYREKRREGATILESALVMPVFLLMLIGFIIAGLGVFRFQEVAALAREGSRYASVHGNMYTFYTGKPAATKEDVYKTAILPNVAGLDVKQLTYDVTWSPNKQPGSLVTVSVKYRWVPEAFFGGMDLTSSSTVTLAY